MISKKKKDFLQNLLCFFFFIAMSYQKEVLIDKIDKKNCIIFFKSWKITKKKKINNEMNISLLLIFNFSRINI